MRIMLKNLLIVLIELYLLGCQKLVNLVIACHRSHLEKGRNRGSAFYYPMPLSDAKMLLSA